jgi:hypothetical protein
MLLPLLDRSLAGGGGGGGEGGAHLDPPPRLRLPPPGVPFTPQILLPLQSLRLRGGQQVLEALEEEEAAAAVAAVAQTLSVRSAWMRARTRCWCPVAICFARAAAIG